MYSRIFSVKLGESYLSTECKNFMRYNLLTTNICYDRQPLRMPVSSDIKNAAGVQVKLRIEGHSKLYSYNLNFIVYTTIKVEDHRSIRTFMIYTQYKIYLPPAHWLKWVENISASNKNYTNSANN